MLTLDQVMNESRWVAKMQGWRAAGTYAEVGYLAEDPDCRDFDLAAEQPEHLKEFFDLLEAHESWCTIPEFYETVYAPMKYDEEMQALVEKVRDKFIENKLWYYDIEYTLGNSPDKGMVRVDINWGDWKHEHARVDWLVRELGGTCEKVEVTEENGSDCYSASHYYRFN